MAPAWVVGVEGDFAYMEGCSWKLARKLGMSERNLRQLRWSNCDAAIWQFITSKSAICCIQDSWPLGFHEVSSFAHAFRRYGGKTPEPDTAGVY